MARTVLVVDDSTSMRQMVTFTLEQGGFKVIQGINGKDALDKVDAQKLDLVLTDLNMPVMDGIAFIRNFRARPGCKGTPVLVLTTESQDVKKQEAKAAGATGWIVKPFQPTKLMETISRVLP